MGLVFDPIQVSKINQNRVMLTSNSCRLNVSRPQVSHSEPLNSHEPLLPPHAACRNLSFNRWNDQWLVQFTTVHFPAFHSSNPEMWWLQVSQSVSKCDKGHYFKLHHFVIFYVQGIHLTG
ncbi:hypothetical protein JOB18_001806 [Solea senegalensis]|uniref:Uncharacterized protein n=1 Tax=Solea senegalensis TaxID=28829 RepID=A0AAV6QLG0_SOLSE|nr:hypothetical protein JOB18_001806 [Solea senegalensis]